MSTARPEGSLLPEAWKVHLPIFDGPLDLLLHLVKLNKVEIVDIPVATVCDQFHAYLMLMEELNLDIAGEYIYEAAQLIFLKSRLLLPQLKRDEGEPEEDPREVLVQRLLEYQRLKEAAQALAEVDRMRLGIFTREPQSIDAAPAEDGEVEIGDVSLFDLLRAFRTVLVRYDRENPPAIELQGEVFSVRGQIDRLLGRLTAGRPFDLLDDLRTRSCRAEAISAFLAVLELARLHLIQLHQTEAGDILLHRTTREAAESELVGFDPQGAVS
jgi:segregation and condensation protein A